LSNVLGDTALLDVAIVVDATNSVEAAEVVVWRQEPERSVRLMQIHSVGGELSRSVHEVEPKS
jgi:hypothetical protein